jgi:hypothetical protein
VPLPLAGFSASESVAVQGRRWGGKQDAAAPEGHPAPLSRVPRMLLVALSLATASVLWLAPVAAGAVPTNDDFADAQALAGGLPIGLSATNAEATKEPGEPIHGDLGSKGHSVWFEWEATSSGFVTVGTCGSDFTTVVSVYTGAKVDELTKVAGDYSSQGPGCPSYEGHEVTFKATSGTTYAIAVDGDAFYVPPAEPPLGEGAIELQVKATLVPPNDDFADATPIVGSIEEEPGAEKAFYWANVRGFNWNADKELGEPDHAGDPGGASVWYSWTAPGPGPANAGSCEGKPLVAAVYTGDSLDALTPVGSNELPCGVTFTASAGATYRIALDGEFDTEAGGPALGSFSVHVSMQLPPQLPVDAPTSLPSLPLDSTAPDTMIGRRAINTAKRRATFVFRSSESESSFRCKLDKRRFVLCGSPKTYKGLKPGRHVFRVAAVDVAGNVDRWPAVARFSIPKSKSESKRRRYGR